MYDVVTAAYVVIYEFGKLTPSSVCTKASFPVKQVVKSSNSNECIKPTLNGKLIELTKLNVFAWPAMIKWLTIVFPC
jgi:hypothetical protein